MISLDCFRLYSVFKEEFIWIGNPGSEYLYVMDISFLVFLLGRLKVIFVLLLSVFLLNLTAHFWSFNKDEEWMASHLKYYLSKEGKRVSIQYDVPYDYLELCICRDIYLWDSCSHIWEVGMGLASTYTAGEMIWSLCQTKDVASILCTSNWICGQNPIYYCITLSSKKH